MSSVRSPEEELLIENQEAMAEAVKKFLAASLAASDPDIREDFAWDSFRASYSNYNKEGSSEEHNRAIAQAFTVIKGIIANKNLDYWFQVMEATGSQKLLNDITQPVMQAEVKTKQEPISPSAASLYSQIAAKDTLTAAENTFRQEVTALLKPGIQLFKQVQTAIKKQQEKAQAASLAKQQTDAGASPQAARVETKAQHSPTGPVRIETMEGKEEQLTISQHFDRIKAKKTSFLGRGEPGTIELIRKIFEGKETIKLDLDDRERKDLPKFLAKYGITEEQLKDPPDLRTQYLAAAVLSDLKRAGKDYYKAKDQGRRVKQYDLYDDFCAVGEKIRNGLAVDKAKEEMNSRLNEIYKKANEGHYKHKAKAEAPTPTGAMISLGQQKRKG